MKETLAFKQIEDRTTPIREIQCAGKGKTKNKNDGQQFYNAKHRTNGHILKYQLNTTDRKN